MAVYNRCIIHAHLCDCDCTTSKLAIIEYVYDRYFINLTNSLSDRSYYIMDYSNIIDSE